MAMATAKLYIEIRFAWWFRWLFCPILKTVCWVNDLLGIKYEPTPIIIKAVDKACKFKTVARRDET